MSPYRLITIFLCLLFGLGQHLMALTVNDLDTSYLEGTWTGTMTGTQMNPITFECDETGLITSGQETFPGQGSGTVSGQLTVGAGGNISGSITVSTSVGGQVLGTATVGQYPVTMTIIQNGTRLQIQGHLIAPYQPATTTPPMTDTLSVIRGEQLPLPPAKAELSRGGTAISDGSTDAYPFIGVVGDPLLFNYILANSGGNAFTLRNGGVTLSNLVNCTATTTQPDLVAISGFMMELSPFVVTVIPSSAGTWSCAASFAHNGEGVTTHSWTITGSATADHQEEILIQRGSTTITNGSTDAVGATAFVSGQSQGLTYVVTNLGSDVLLVGPPTLSGFINCTVTSNVSGQTNIAATGNSSFTLTVTPTAVGPWSFIVTEPSNDDSEPSTDWTVSGAAQLVVAVSDQRSCGLGGGFALFALALGFAGMSFFNSRSRLRQKRFMSVGTVAITTLLMSASRISAEEWNSVVEYDTENRYDSTLVNDWRLGYTMLSTKADVSLLDKSASGLDPNYKLETNWDQAGRTGVMWMTPLSTADEFILGLELSTNRFALDNGTNYPGLDLRTYQLTVHPGLGWSIDDRLVIEVNPFVSLGYAQLDVTGLGSSSDLYYELGLRFGSYYTWRNGFQLGLQTGYLYGTTKSELSAGSAKYDSDIKLNGIFLGIQFGIRL
jgi:hypothetical protein